MRTLLCMTLVGLLGCQASTKAPAGDWQLSYSHMCTHHFGSTSESVERHFSNAVDKLSGAVDKQVCTAAQDQLNHANETLRTAEMVRGAVSAGQPPWNEAELGPIAPGSLLLIVPMLHNCVHDPQGTLAEVRAARQTARDALREQRARCTARGIIL